PGDRVRQGAEFARLDDHELRLERVKWASQREQYQRQYEEAMASRNRAQARILLAQIAQADARLALTESRLQRTRITAPFDGIVVSGDLSQRLGASVQEGEVLFELAPLDAYRVELLVDERDIALVQEQQQGNLIASALPGVKFPFTVTRITPISVPGEGWNRFRVEARLARNDPRLRPGMEGVGKIDTGEQPLITVWTRRLRHWLSLQWWSWFG
ncbi:MAG TPA: HlyD family efflux transporter periplasmic adaptor subunit, partial [Gammaproteobacteria bacterium]|nr:HlyD family efflux transporter periplasmic adaptor subunit [Gammaproteobacteria bacterium]